MAVSSLRLNATNTSAALELFDGLPGVDLAFMLGDWRGEGFPTGHPLDGLLECCHWRGKRFDSPETVHPLIFQGLGGGDVRIDPGRIGSMLVLATRLPLPKTALAGLVFRLCIPFLITGQSRARLRMTSFRGQTSATMLYDQLPICDSFRRLDDNTVLGVMDHKHIPRPFFFLLRRMDGPQRDSHPVSHHTAAA